MSNIVYTICVFILLMLPNFAKSQQCDDPESLRFSLIPSQDLSREVAYFEPILDLLAERTGKKVELVLPRSYSSVINGLVGKWVDIAILGPEAYVRAHSIDMSIEPFAANWRRADGLQESGAGYRSVLITLKKSKLESLESLGGSVLALVDKASTSGYLVPEIMFPKINNLPPLEQYFSKLIFSGKHDASIEAITGGKADAAFVSSYRFMELVNIGKIKLEDFNILWKSQLLPPNPYVYRGSLCENVKQKVAETFLASDQSPEGRRFLNNIRSEKIIKAIDSDYDIIRSVSK